MKALAVLLIAIGLVGLIYGGVRWTHREKVVDLGPVQVSRDKHESVPLPPIAGAVCLLGGVALLVSASRRGHA